MFLCQLDGTTGCSDEIPGVFLRVFPDETSIWVCGLSKADCPSPCGRPSSNSLRTWIEQSVEDGGICPLSTCRPSCTGTLLFSALGLRLTPQLPWFSGLQTQARIPPQAFWEFQLADSSYFPAPSSFVYIYIFLLSLFPVSLENSNTERLDKLNGWMDRWHEMTWDEMRLTEPESINFKVVLGSNKNDYNHQWLSLFLCRELAKHLTYVLGLQLGGERTESPGCGLQSSVGSTTQAEWLCSVANAVSVCSEPHDREPNPCPLLVFRCG